MQTKESVRFENSCAREQNDELIGVLTAISIVSKRLAKKLRLLEQKTDAEKGGKSDEQDE